LTWPLLLRKWKNELALAISLIAGIVLTKILLYKFSGHAVWKEHPGLLYRAYLFFYYNRLDCLLLGAIPAILIHRKSEFWISLVTNVRYTIAVLILLITLYVCGLTLIRIDYVYYALFFTWLLSSLSLAQNKKPMRCMNFTEQMGRASYGIYLWHFIMLFIAFALLNYFFAEANRNSIAANVFLYIATYLLTYTIGVLSYRFIEVPILKLKNKTL
jgi:peptidoglycan/LPS O-acetylase OafA/YrhL